MRGTILALGLAAALAAAGCAVPAEPPPAGVASPLAVADVSALGDLYNATREGLIRANAEGRFGDGVHAAAVAGTMKATLAALLAAESAVAAGHQATARQWLDAAGLGVARMQTYLRAAGQAAPAGESA